MEKLDNSLFFSEKAMYDMALVERALKKNDQKAYEELMGRYWEPVFFMLNRMVNNKEDAEDLTIEAFGKAFRFLNQYSTRFAFSTWLFKIASNNAIDFIRRNKERGLHTSLNKPVDNDGGDELSAFIKDNNHSPEEAFIARQGAERIKQLFDKIKPQHREIIELYFVEQLKLEEIVERVKLPLSTVKARIYRSCELLVSLSGGKNNL